MQFAKPGVLKNIQRLFIGPKFKLLLGQILIFDKLLPKKFVV
jgi:hypothetical protein